jgi:CRISPR system Cascade subunit CasD
MSNPPLLLLRLEGPLQSWGVRARWDVRDTGEEPSKSGVVGLLGCALGYPGGDLRLAQLDRATTLGVRAEYEGRPTVDYQTVTGLLPQADGGVKGRENHPYTIISPRAYLQDAAFLAVLAGPGDLLNDCARALASPRWPLYLGRKCCPPSRPPLEALTTDYGSLGEALREHPWEWPGHDQPEPERVRCVLDDPEGEAVRPDAVRTNPARMYGNRRVTVFWVPCPPSKGG